MSASTIDHTHNSQPLSAELPLIPLNDLRRQTEALRADYDRAYSAVLTSGWYVLGPNVTAFENEFATYCGARHCLAVGNGTDALELALRALGCGPGSEIVTVANAGMYSTSAILTVGAMPVLSDIDPLTMDMAPESLKRVIGARTKAVIATHLYGRLADLDRLLAITKASRIPLIEDCAQAHGAERGGKKAGTVGAMGCFSFYPTKNLGALGDGGAVVTNDADLFETVKSLRQYGWRAKYDSERPYGRNSRLDELQAAFLRLKLPKLDGWNARRREIIGRYRLAAPNTVIVPDAAGLDHVGHLCVVRSENRSALREFLTSHKIATDIHYPIPDHLQQAMRGILNTNADLPHTIRATEEILTLPCFPEMTEDEIARVCSALAAFAETR